MSKDHTSGSPLDVGAESAVDPHFATPFAEAGGGAESESPGDESAAVAESAPPRFSSPPDEQPTDAIEFRVIRPGAPIRRLRLTGNRYTFGSAEGCSIRLNDHALRPMHAVLIRDTSRILVRAYSVPIQVNGTRTTEATLQVGDVLRLGAYQFELLSALKSSASSPLGPRFSTAPRSVFDSPTPSGSSGAFESSRPGSTSSYRGGGRELPASEDVIWRERLRREIDQWRDRQDECDRRENRCDERESDLRTRESELWSRAENLYRRESRLQSQEAAAFQLYDEFAQRQEELIRLREETQSRQEQFRLREIEFRNEEFEYRRRLEEATRQLQQSQQQAESATEAVQRMREQFEALNQQIEALSTQQEDIESRELQQREEHERLRLDLEKARDEAIDAQAESEARRSEAETRVDELTAEVAELKSGRGPDEQEQQARLEESQRIAEELRQQVEELQNTVTVASEESSRLRSDYEDACESVRQLESIVAQSAERGDQDRESWAAEADELRSAMDQLSRELARANSELTELREANTELSSRLDLMQQERDEAREEAESRPTSEAFESLRGQLEHANEKLADMKREYDETLARLEQQESPTEKDHTATALLAPAVPTGAFTDATDGDETATAEPQDIVETEIADDAEPMTPDNRVGEEEAAAVSDEDDGAWPTYDSPEENQQASNPQAIETDKADESQWAAADEPEQADATSDTGTDEFENAGEVESTLAWEGPEDADAESYRDEAVDQGVSDEATSRPDADHDAAGTVAETEAVADEAEPGFWGDESGEHSAVDNVDASQDFPWQQETAGEPESETTWGDAVTEEDANWNQADDAPGEDEYSQQDAGQTGDQWSQDASPDPAAEQDPDAADQPASDESQDDDSMIQESLASMLIKDIEAEAEQAGAGPEGTFVMDEAPESSVWDDSAEAVSWDQEHTEESYASEWSNNEDGYRVEHVEETSPFEGDLADAYSETADDEAGDAAHEDATSESYESEGYEAQGYASEQYPSESYDSESYESQDDTTENDESESYDSQGDASESYDSESYDSESYDSESYDSEGCETEGYETEGYETEGYESEGYESEGYESEGYETESYESEPEPSQLDQPAVAPAASDDSIEAYMNRLLQRCQGDEDDEATPTESVSLSTTGESNLMAAAETEIGEHEVEETAEERIDPDAPLVPRSQAPEKNSDLSAMRELANASARSAISRSVRVQTRDTQIRGVVNLGCALGALLCGAACYFFIPGNIRWVAVGMTVIVAMIYTKDGLAMLAQAKSRMNAAENCERDEAEKDSAEASEPEAVTDDA